MLAVSNTSPVSNLAVIGRLALLKSQFSEIWIPTSVWNELALHPDATVRAAIQDGINAGWIRCGSVCAGSPLLNLLLLQLHAGEAETIALAVDMKANMAIIDEQEGRKLAAQVGLKVTGVLGILRRAKREGQIPALKPEIQSLRSLGNFFIASSLEAKVLAAAGE